MVNTVPGFLYCTWIKFYFISNCISVHCTVNTVPGLGSILLVTVSPYTVRFISISVHCTVYALPCLGSILLVNIFPYAVRFMLYLA